MKEIMNYYKDLVEFLGIVMGENCEIALQDVSEENHCIVAIANGHISGRKVGSPITDLALKFLKSEIWKEKNFVSNYTGKTKNNKILNSSTYFIKENGNLLGMLCVNIDNSQYIDLSKAILSLGGIKLPLESPSAANSGVDSINQPNTETENFFEDPKDIVNSVIEEFLQENEVPKERLTPKEKISIVEKIENTGIFNIKGSVGYVADVLMMSEASVYRYRSKIQKLNKSSL